MNACGRLPAVLETKEGYQKAFLSLEIWKPYVECLCRENKWSCEEIIPGRTGSFPTFIVDQQRVIKFLGPLYDGENCWRVEREADQILTALPGIPVARLIDAGEVEGEAKWRYLVFEYVSGVNISEVYTRIPYEEKLELVRWLGGWLPGMHRLKPSKKSALPIINKDLVLRWFESRWQEDMKRWPDTLAGQVEGYLSQHASQIQTGDESFIHADLTQDHFLGQLERERWTTNAVIDFGDAMRANMYYELVALHLDLFAGEKCLLKEFLDAYGFSPDPDFSRKAMVTCLLHQFDAIGYLFQWKPELQELRSLDELETRLWSIGD